MINLFQVLPATFIQESLETREQYENVDALYKIDNEVRLALLDLLRLRKLKLFYGIVYAFGINNYGELGIGFIDSVSVPTPIDYSRIIDNKGQEKRVIQVSGGGSYSLILCEDGTVYSFGSNDFGELGSNNIDGVDIATPIDTSNIGSKRVIQVSAGSSHSLLLCEDGSVYSFGFNVFGRLGTGDSITGGIATSIDTSLMVDEVGRIKRVIQVSAGGSHSLILCEDGSVYSFGNGQSGQLGIGNIVNVPIPTEIDTSNIGSKRVIQISAGDVHSLILCEDGTVYSFGWNAFGQLGNETSDDINNVAIPINTSNMLDKEGKEKRVIQVAAGVNHSLILCEDGTVYSFGLNEDGQLGNGSTDNVTTPTEIDTSNMEGKRVIQISAGAEHSLILSEDGAVFSFGDVNYREIPTLLIGDKRVIQISAGYGHLLFLI